MSAMRKSRSAAFTPLQRPDADDAGNTPTFSSVTTVKRPEGRGPKTTAPEDFEFALFPVRHSFSGGGNQRGGLGKAHQLFGDKLPALLDELNIVLAA